MTLLELPCDYSATVVSIHAPTTEEERLHAIGIYAGSTIKKIQQSLHSPQQPVCIATDAYSIFAISRTLAAAIKIRLT